MPIPILTDEQIAGLAPSLLLSPSPDADADRDVRDRFASVYAPLRDEGMNDYDLSRLASAIYYFRPMLASILAPSREKHVVEVGCGWGLKGLAWADLFATYVGVELESDRAAQANASFERFGLSNARAVAGNAEAIVRDPSRHGIERVDLLVLYAVLEHLTLPERRSILGLAQDVYRRGGHVLVAETPNRLSPFDTHSFQLPFVEWLPIELQEEYVSRSPRADLKARLDAAPPEGKAEALWRIGRGLSFHEFACFWEKEIYESLSAARDGFSPALLNLEPFRREEADLMRFCGDNGVDVHRMFHRYWLYGLLARGSAPAEGRRAAYLPPRALGRGTVRRERRELWALDEVSILSLPWDALTIRGDGEAVLLIDAGRSRGTIRVRARRPGGRAETRSVRLDDLGRARLPTWHEHVALPLGRSEGATYRITVRGDGPLRPGRLVCHGALIA